MLVVAYATGRASNARQVKDGDPDKKGYPGPAKLGVGREANNLTPQKYIVAKPQEEAKALPGL